MNDMSSVIVPKSDQINADDLIGGPRTITISEVAIRPGTEQPVSIQFDGGNGKVWRPCKSMSRVLVAAWGPDAKQYVGRSVTLYRDPNVKWGGLAVGGIRISHLSHIERDMVMALTETKGKRAPYKVQVLSGTTTNAPSIEAARNAIANAADVETLRKVWVSKAMAPFRDTLQADMEARKLTLEGDPFGEGPTDNDHGETLTLAQAIDEIANAPSAQRVDELLRAHEAAFGDDAADLRAAAMTRHEELID